MEQAIKIEAQDIKPCARLIEASKSGCDGVGIIFPPIMVDGKWKGIELTFTKDGKPDSIKIWDMKESYDTGPKGE